MVHLGPAYPDDPSSGSTDTTTPKEDDLPTNNNNINNDNATATTELIEEEDPATIPIDETAFTHPPHFSSTNPLHRSLRDLDLSYRCTICFELYNVPVSLYPCLHSFCSVCIRKNLKTQYASMKRKAECPMCNANLIGGGRASGDYEKAILPNRELENRVDLYKMRVREELRRSLVRLDILERRDRMNNQGCNNNNDEEQPQQQQQSSAAALSSAKRARRSTANYKREYSEQDDEETMTYNNNIDALQPPRKRKPTISYHGLKRKKLIELCSNENLSTSGSDMELKNRHSEFILLYNSQCDSQHPMSAQDVAQMVMKEEQNRKREAKIESSTAVFGGSKQKVEGEMENTFKQMIERLKKARNKKDGDDDANEMKTDTTNGGGGDDEGSSSIPSCIVAATATATAAALMNGSTISGNFNAASSKPAVSTAAAAAASSSASTSTIRSTAAAINEDVKSKKTTPSKSRRSTTTTTRGTSKQATISSSAKKKKSYSSSATTTTSGGVWKCLTCTFENHKFTRVNAICEMCSTPRPEKENTSNEVIAIDC